MSVKNNSWIINILYLLVIVILDIQGTLARRLLRSVEQPYDNTSTTNSAEFIWSTTTVAVGDTAVLHCSFDAIFQQQLLRSGNINWMKEATKVEPSLLDKYVTLETVDGSATWIAGGKKMMVDDSRYRVYRPRNSALSVLIIRGCKQKDAGVYRCNLSGSSTRHKFMILNVTESTIEAQTSPASLRARIGSDVTLWCNATGYPKPVVYWTREDRNRRLPDGSYQFWGNGLAIKNAVERETGIYACFLDNFVQPIVSYKFSLIVEDNPWSLQGYKMLFNGKRWYSQESIEPLPMRDRSFLLMCEARGGTDPLPLIRWYRNGRILRNGRHFHVIKNSVPAKSGHESSTLVIINYQSRFEGNYTCVASNVHRMKKLTFYLKENPEEQNSPLKVIGDQEFEVGGLSKENSSRLKDKHIPYDNPPGDPGSTTIQTNALLNKGNKKPVIPISLTTQLKGTKFTDAKGQQSQQQKYSNVGETRKGNSALPLEIVLNIPERPQIREFKDSDKQTDFDDDEADDDESNRIWNLSNDGEDYDDDDDYDVTSRKKRRYRNV